jgi:hypothetical protein
MTWKDTVRASGPVAWALVKEAKQEILILVVGIMLGLAGGWRLWKPGLKPRPETYAASTTQKDGSVQLERKPDPAAKPAHEVPKGAVVERIVRVVVRPASAVPEIPVLPSSASGPGAPDLAHLEPASPSTGCPPVRVDLTLVRLQDQSRRVIASSPDGQVVGGVDIPVEAAKPIRDLKWAAGVSYNPGEKTYGAFVDRDAAFLRLGLEANQIREPVMAGGRTTVDFRVKVGIRF